MFRLFFWLVRHVAGGLQPARLSILILRYCAGMPQCKSCGEEAATLVRVQVDGKAKKLCEDCADLVREQAEVAEQSEGAVQQMMGFKGRR
jgi:hypothetical protein